MRNDRLSQFRTFLLPAVAFLVIAGSSHPLSAKTYKVTIGYENEKMDTQVNPGRKAPENGTMPAPLAPELDSSLPTPTPGQTVVPAASPPQPSTQREPVDFETPRKNGFDLPGGFGIITPEEIKTQLDTTGRATANGIQFDFESTALKPSSRPALEAILSYLQDNPATRILLEGHTDNSGDAAYNMLLSRQRAESVKNWLVNGGINDGRIETVGRGETQPIADNGTEAGMAANRRVDIVKL